MRVSSPGRVCLFGEHQDYLGLPVISLAISLRITVEGERRNDARVLVALPDVGAEVDFSLDEPLRYEGTRDYIRGAVNVLRREGFSFSTGFDCVVRGEIPISAGTSSSSALAASWVSFLARMADEPRALEPEECGRLAHAAEVLEFSEPGGMMDQYTAAFGGLLFIGFEPALGVERLAAPLGAFVLGDSREPKDTMAILARVKTRVLAIARRLAEIRPGFSLHTTRPDESERLGAGLDRGDRDLLAATIANRDLTREALGLLRREPLDHRELGALLGRHHAILRDALDISTPRIERMLAAAAEAGAYGGKINGSGGGGCMFAYAPESPERVARAIEEAGGTAYIVRRDVGTRAEPPLGASYETGTT